LSEVLALRSRAISRGDQRILEDSEFFRDVISGLDDLVKKNLRLSRQRMDIAAMENRCAGNTIFTYASIVVANSAKPVFKRRRT